MDYTYNLSEVKNALHNVIKNHFTCSLDLNKSGSYYKLSSVTEDDGEELLPRCEGNNDYTILWEEDSEDSINLALQSTNNSNNRNVFIVDNAVSPCDKLTQFKVSPDQSVSEDDNKDDSNIQDNTSCGEDDSTVNTTRFTEISDSVDQIQMIPYNSKFSNFSDRTPLDDESSCGSMYTSDDTDSLLRRMSFSGSTYSISRSITEVKQSPFSRTYNRLFNRDKYVVNKATYSSEQEKTVNTVGQVCCNNTTQDGCVTPVRRQSFSGSTYSISNSVTEIQKSRFRRTYSKLLSRDKYAVNDKHSTNCTHPSETSVTDNQIKPFHRIYSRMFARKKYAVNKRQVTKCFTQ